MASTVVIPKCSRRPGWRSTSSSRPAACQNSRARANRSATSPPRALMWNRTGSPTAALRASSVLAVDVLAPAHEVQLPPSEALRARRPERLDQLDLLLRVPRRGGEEPAHREDHPALLPRRAQPHRRGRWVADRPTAAPPSAPCTGSSRRCAGRSRGTRSRTAGRGADAAAPARRGAGRRAEVRGARATPPLRACGRRRCHVPRVARRCHS